MKESAKSQFRAHRRTPVTCRAYAVLRRDYAPRHGPCLGQRLDRDMDATKRNEDATLELDAELETWNWARAAGVSLGELRLALVALATQPELRKAA